MKIFKAMIGKVLAFLMFASAAIAYTSMKTSLDFSDLAHVDSELKAKIDELLAKGIFEGTSSTTFGSNEMLTRAQFAKVLVLTYGIKADMNMMTSSFSDLQSSDAENGWAIPYIEAAKMAGLIDGVTATEYAPGNNVTFGQLSTALVKGIGKKVDVTGKPWYANALHEAKKSKFLPAEVDGDALVTRADMVLASYAAWQTYCCNTGQPTHLSMLEANAVDAQRVKVTFDREVYGSDVTLTLKRDTFIVATKTVWSLDHKSATLVLTDGSLTKGDYTLSLSGINTGIIKIGTIAFHYE